MDYYNFIIDFDFNKVRIYKYDCGIVLSEEDLAVVSNKSKPAKVLVGGDATGEFKRSLDKNTCIIKSVKNGRIEDLDTCAQMLNMLLAKVEKKSFRKKRNIVFLVPCGLTKSEQDDYISLGYMLSANNIRLITKIQMHKQNSEI